MSIRISKLSLALVAALAAGCAAAGDDNPNNAGSGGPLPGGVGGGVGGATPPLGGVGGATPPVGGAAGTTMLPAGMGGAAGTTMLPAGMGGSMMMPQGGGGGGGMGGSAGMGGAGGTMAMDPGDAQCLLDVMAAGTAVTACEMCLCKMDKCRAELMALKGDTNGNALVKCSREKKCSGTCCVCRVAECGALGENYGMGPCINEIETAAGVTPGQGALVNGGTVMTNCAASGPATNSCARAVRLGECSAMKCMAECMTPVCM
jgi:hypothetical protein